MQFFSPDIFPVRGIGEIRTALREIFSRDIRTTRELLNALHARKGERILWADKGGGFALPMRELAGMRQKVRMINTDLFNWEPDDVQSEVKQQLEELLGFSLSDEARKSEFILDDITVASLPEPSDFTTSFQVLQYLDNPLRAICTWYNQLSDFGLVLFGTKHCFSEWIRDCRKQGGNPSVFLSFIDALRAAGIRVVAPNVNERTSLTPEFNTCMIERAPHTTLQLRSQLKSAEVVHRDHNYKATYHDSGDHPVEVLRTE